MATRPTPFDLALAEFAAERFPALRDTLDRSGVDPADRDAFLLGREAVQALRDLRPDEGLGEGIRELAALLHHAYLHWAGGCRTVEVDRPALDRLLEGDTDTALPSGAPYIQLPVRFLWAEAVAGGPVEPLDGLFMHQSAAGVRALGVFGFHPERTAFTVVEVEGARPGVLARVDGSAPYSPTLAGGAAAGLRSLAGAEELLDLAWRLGTLP
jgi:hypothetical protein